MAYGEFAPDCREIAYAAQDGEIRKMARFSKSLLSLMDRNPATKTVERWSGDVREFSWAFLRLG